MYDVQQTQKDVNGTNHELPIALFFFLYLLPILFLDFYYRVSRQILQCQWHHVIQIVPKNNIFKQINVIETGTKIVVAPVHDSRDLFSRRVSAEISHMCLIS